MNVNLKTFSLDIIREQNLLRKKSLHRGFTVLEILMVISIVAILSYVSVIKFSDMRENAELNAAANAIISHLEESKANAVAGLYGEAHGVHFTESAYVQFVGEVYDSADGNNIAYEIPDDFEISAGEESVVFSRMSGGVNNQIIVTVMSRDDNAKKKDIIIGRGGDVTLDE